jgi:hypothetical protein
MLHNNANVNVISPANQITEKHVFHDMRFFLLPE